MSDHEYEEDDLDILTSLLDEEDDKEEDKIKTRNAATASYLSRYSDTKLPNISHKPMADTATSRKYSRSAQRNSENEVSLSSSASQVGSSKVGGLGDSKMKLSLESSATDAGCSKEYDYVADFDEEDLDDLTALLEVEKTDTTKPTTKPVPNQDIDEDINDLTALLEVEKTDTTKTVPNLGMSASQSSSKSHSTQIKSEDNTSAGKSDEDKSKEELLEELARMRAAVEEMKKQTSPKNKNISVKSSTRSPPRESFSEALAPKLETTPKSHRNNKSNTSTLSQQSVRSTKYLANTTRGDPSKVATADGNQQKKKMYTMDAAAATNLFHCSQSEDDDKNVDSSEEEDDQIQDVKSSSTPASSKQFTRNKQRVAHTPNNQPIKPKKESPYKCKLCEKTFDDFQTFKTHQFIHRENAAQSCSICKKVFSSRNQLEMHTRIHGENEYKELMGRGKSSSGLSSSGSSSSVLSTSSSNKRAQIPSSNYKSGFRSAGCKPNSQVSRTQNKIPDEGPMEVEFYSQIRIINPVISSSSMKEKMSGRKFIRLSVIKKYMSGEDIEGDWATMGVIVSKIPPKTSSKGKVFSIWKINDLRNLNCTVAVFLFNKVHEHHWKSTEGSVVGILNANIMPNRDHGQSDELAMTVDHPQKMMIMGKSKDFGFCKSKKKNGNPCTMFVNKGECEFCEYHVQSEYKKVSAKRSDLQSSFSSTAPKNIKKRFNGALNANFFHGGKMYSAGSDSVKVKATHQKKAKNAVMHNLGSGKGVQKLVDDARKNVVLMHGRGNQEEDTLVSISGATPQFKELLSQPSPGAQNLMRHMVTAETKEQPNLQLVSASDLLKQQKKEFKAAQNARLDNAPRLGKGIDDDDFIFFNECPVRNKALAKSRSKSGMNAVVAKRKALAMIEKKGPLTKQDPNCVGRDRRRDEGSAEKKQDAVKRRAERDWRERNGTESSPESCLEPAKKKKRFLEESGTMSKEEMSRLINAKSKHAGLLAEVEAEWQEKYFSQLEKKEELETKMSSVMSKKCKVVSCKQCQYTWFVPSKLCIQERHTLNRHEAQERFFTCSHCKTRSITFDRIPTRPCRSCGSTNFDRTSMFRERKGPQLESEKLLIRGEERKYVNS